MHRLRGPCVPVQTLGGITAWNKVKPGTWPVGSLAGDQQCLGPCVVRSQPYGRCSCADCSQARTATLRRQFDRWLPPHKQ